MSADRALGAAMRAACLSDTNIAALIGARFYDDAPADVAYPYVTFGRFQSRPLDAAAQDACEHVVTLHVWSRHGGRAEALACAHALGARLHNGDLAIAGRRLVLLFVVFTDVFRAGDGLTTHAVLRLRAVTEPID